MKYFDLDQEEKQIESDFAKGEFKSVKNLAKWKKYYQKIAKNSLGKTKNVNLRISLHTLHNLKTRAVREGIPYQTLAGSVLHKYATGQFDK